MQVYQQLGFTEAAYRAISWADTEWRDLPPNQALPGI